MKSVLNVGVPIIKFDFIQLTRRRVVVYTITRR